MKKWDELVEEEQQKYIDKARYLIDNKYLTSKDDEYEVAREMYENKNVRNKNRK